MTRKPRRKRRRKHTREDLLEASGTVLQEVETPAPSRPWIPLFRGLVEAIPFHAETRKGREFAIFVRLLVGVAAVMMVTKGRDDWGWGVAGVAAALSTLLVPLAETRRLRWIRRLNARLDPTTSLVHHPAQVDFDGRKVSIRVDGRVWRSQRPFDPPGTTRLVQIGDSLWLGLIPAEGRKRDPLWFRTSTAELDDRFPTSDARDEPPDTPMNLDADGFIAVHEAFVHRL